MGNNRGEWKECEGVCDMNGGSVEEEDGENS